MSERSVVLILNRRPRIPGLPTGTVTFLFSDIEGSTRLLQDLGDSYQDVLVTYRRLFRTALRETGGYEVSAYGDAFFVAFANAGDALAAAVNAQRAILAHPWPTGTRVRVRMGLHAGMQHSAMDDYVGLDVHRAARICATSRGGQILLSQATRELVGDDLPPTVGLRNLGSHRLKDLAQPETLFQVLHPDLPADFPPILSLEMFVNNNLPRYLTSFIGRERDMAEVKRLLTNTAVLTLTGTGGIGKTRLAVHVAADVLEDYPDGAWLVELAAVSDPALVPQAVASALAVRETPGRPLLETLLSYFQRKQLLLILDNCEHVVAACAHLAAAVLRACGHVRILATSREILGIPGETVWRVPPLTLPNPDRQRSGEPLTRFEAVRLFVERAMAIHPSFALTADNTASVATIVQRVDGIPLAVELAAARVPALSVQQIAARLDDRFRLLTRGYRASLQRHQTLRDALDWSYRLLSEGEQTLLRRLSAFAGGWTLEAAETVCAGDRVEPAGILDILTQLVLKSFALVDERHGNARYRFLETVRQYGQQRLLESGETGPVRARHADCYLKMAEQAEPALMGPEQETWLERLELEHSNLREALRWFVERGEAEPGLRLAGALSLFWDLRGYPGEGREQLEAVLKQGEGAPGILRAKALYGAGFLAVRQGDNAAARLLLDESLAVSRQVEDQRGVAWTLATLGHMALRQGNLIAARALGQESLTTARQVKHPIAIGWALELLGVVAFRQRDYATADALLGESLQICRAIGHKLGIAVVLSHLGEVASSQGQFATARSMYEESLAIRRALGDKPGIAWSLDDLGSVTWRQDGDYTAARGLYEESLAIKRSLGEKKGIADTLGNLGHIAVRQGNYAEARALLEERLAISQEVADKRGVCLSLEDFADIAVAEQKAARAARLFGAAEALREMLGEPLSPIDRADYERAVATVQAALDQTAFDGAWAEGRAMTLAKAIEYALFGAAP